MSIRSSRITSDDHDTANQLQNLISVAMIEDSINRSGPENEGISDDERQAKLLHESFSARLFHRCRPICSAGVQRTAGIAICCCPERIHSKCLSSKKLLITYLTTIITLIIILSAGFYHVWDMYGDSPTGGCLRDPKTMNNFRYILRSLATVTRQHNISWWADFGVLLGGHQRGDILPWDRDLDISMFADDLELLRNDTVKDILYKEYGLWVCPKRKCIRPSWSPNWYPEIDINLWEIEGDTVKYWRSEEEKKDPIREAVFSKYNDFPLELLFPLTNLSIGGVNVPVPGRYEEVLKVRYPHSFGISLPYNPRCWWSALTNNLERSKQSASITEITITTPPEIHENWPWEKKAKPGGPPIQFMLDEPGGSFVLNPEWVNYQVKWHSEIDAHPRPTLSCDSCKLVEAPFCTEFQYADGQWNYDPTVTQPPYINHEWDNQCDRVGDTSSDEVDPKLVPSIRPELQYVWKPHSCRLLHYSRQAFCELLGGRNILFAGDPTLSAQHLYSFIHLMHSPETTNQLRIHKDFVDHWMICEEFYPVEQIREGRRRRRTSQGRTVPFSSVLDLPFNRTGSRVGWLGGPSPYDDPTPTAWIDGIERGAYDIVVFNTDIWCADSFSDFKSWLIDLRAILTGRYPSLTFVWRSSYAGHKDCHSHWSSPQHHWNPSHQMNPLTEHQKLHATGPYNWSWVDERNALAKEVFGEAYLDITSMTRLRPDGHLPGQCYGYCQPGPIDEWNKILFHHLMRRYRPPHLQQQRKPTRDGQPPPPPHRRSQREQRERHDPL